MSCALTQGFTKGCRDAQGGVRRIFITEKSNLGTLTSASGVVTAMTLASGKKFWTYEQEMNTASANSAPTPARANGTIYYDQTVNMIINKHTASINYELRALAQVDLLIIVEEQNGLASDNGTYFLYGETNGMALDPSNAPTGTNMGDRNGYEFVFKGQEQFMPNQVPTNIMSTLIVPA